MRRAQLLNGPAPRQPIGSHAGTGLRGVAEERLIRAYENPSEFPPYLKGWMDKHDQIIDGYAESIRNLNDAGVPILLGSDGNFGAFLGWSAHRELERLVAAGLDPWTALAAGTTEAGRFLNRAWGVAPGCEANLLILNASPLESISNTRRIHAVVFRGTVVQR